MKLLCLLVLTPLIALPVEAQKMVTVNALEFYDKIPPPPADTREAYLRAECTENEQGVNCNPGKAYAPTEERLAKIMAEFEGVLRSLAQPQMQAAQGMDAKEMKKKMKSMSDAEKMQYAMEMSRSMGMTAAVAPESPAVNAAMQEYNTMVQGIAKRIRQADQTMKEKAKPAEKRTAQHKEIDAWTEVEMKKVPRLSTGEMDYPEPKAHYALLTKSMQKHIAVENEYLAALRSQWIAERDELKTFFTPYQQKLAAIHYGDDAKNSGMKQSLVNGHIMTFKPLQGLINDSRNATAEAAQWWGGKLQLEREKPQ